MKAGLAVDDRTGQIFAHLRNGFHLEGLVSEFALSGKFLDEAVFEGKSSGLAVELSSSEVYVDEVGSVGAAQPGGAELERLEVPGGHGSGVAVDSARGEVYVADSSRILWTFMVWNRRARRRSGRGARRFRS